MRMTVPIAGADRIAERANRVVFDRTWTSVLMERLYWARRQAEENRREADGLREASRRAEDWLRAIIDNTDALIYMKSINLTYNIMNRKLRRSSALPRERWPA